MDITMKKVSVGDTFVIKNLNTGIIEQYSITEVWIDKKPVGVSHSKFGFGSIIYRGEETSNNDINKGEIRATSGLAKEILNKRKGHKFRWIDEEGNDAEYELIGVVEYDKDDQEESELIDMTAEAKQIVNCVYEAKGRYDRSVIIDAVVGEKSERLTKIGATNYKSYGALFGKNKRIINLLFVQMLKEGYIREVGKNNNVEMGDISELREPSAKVLVKITDENKIPERRYVSKQ